MNRIAAFVDVETTGLSNVTDEIVELCISLFSFDENGNIKILDTYTGQRDPGIPIPKEASRVNGITNDIVKGKKLDDEKVVSILNQAELIVAHNASYDRGFVERMYEISSTKPWYCSMNGIEWKDKGFASKGLSNLAKNHKLKKQTHRADSDVFLALELIGKIDHVTSKPYILEMLQKPASRRRKTAPRAHREVAATYSINKSRNSGSVEKQRKFAFLLWRIIGWIFIPFIMVVFRWKRLNRVQKILGVIWSAFILFIIFGPKEG